MILAKLETEMSNIAIQLDYLGVLPRLGLKGPEVSRWLRDQSITVPVDVLSAAPIDSGAWIARLGAAEFLIEGTADNDFVSHLWKKLSPLPMGVFPIVRCDATFVLSGRDAHLALAQTCAIDFSTALSQRVIFSRVAGVSCGILPEVSGSAIKHRLWVELSYAAYLWNTLTSIVIDLGGLCNGPPVHALTTSQTGPVNSAS